MLLQDRGEQASKAPADVYERPDRRKVITLQNGSYFRTGKIRHRFVAKHTLFFVLGEVLPEWRPQRAFHNRFTRSHAVQHLGYKTVVPLGAKETRPRTH